MGELVSGVGDEVIFFVAFLVLSLCLYIGVLLYKNRRENGGQVMKFGSWIIVPNLVPIESTRVPRQGSTSLVGQRFACLQD